MSGPWWPQGKINVICAWCHNPFRAERRTARYCSEACKSKAHRARKAAPPRLSGDLPSAS